MPGLRVADGRLYGSKSAASSIGPVIGRQSVSIGATREVQAHLADFFELHYDRLVRLAALVCHSADSTEDAVQSAMEQAWRGRHTLADDTRMRPWLDRIVVREAIRLNRRPWWARFGAPSIPAPESAGKAEPGVDPRWISLVDGFRRLPLEQRAAITLHLYAGYSVQETADLMGAGVETTRSRIRLARRRLRTELGEDEP
jgi:DNA-directed RNA polymerase specialized sigma24 family protein